MEGEEEEFICQVKCICAMDPW